MNKIKVILTILFLSQYPLNAKINFLKYKKIKTKECTILVPKDLILKEKVDKYGLYNFEENKKINLSLNKTQVFSMKENTNIYKTIKTFYNLKNGYEKILDKNSSKIKIYGFKRYDWLEKKFNNTFFIRGKLLEMLLFKFSKQEAEDIYNYCIQTKKKDF